MTVAQLRATMPAQEFMQWGIYYSVRAQEAQLARG